MKSKKALFAWLKANFGGEPSLNSPGIGNETYGRDSCIYLWKVNDHWKVSRKEMESRLDAAGFKVHRSYWPGSDAVEVSVSYFKGDNWDV